MSHPVWIVLENADAWQIWRLGPEGVRAIEATIEPVMEANALGQTLAEALRAEGYRQEPILLAVASTSCLTATVDLANFPKSVSNETLRFQLEAMLPISAEQMHAVFVRSPTVACAVVVSQIDWQPRLKAFEDCGLVVQTLMPAAWLGLSHSAIRAALPDSAVLLWEMPWGWELWQQTSGRVARWWSLGQNLSLVQQHLRFLTCQTSGAIAVISVCSDSETPVDLQVQFPEMSVTSLAVDFQAAAQQAAERLLRGQESPILELRTGALGAREPWHPIRRSVWSALLASVLLLACANFGLCWRAQQIMNLAEVFHERQQRLFQQVLPGQPLPVGVRSRLSSEVSKLRALQSEQRGEPKLNSALETLAKSLRVFPNSTQHHVTTLNIDGHALQLEGEVASVGETARFAEAFAGAGCEVSGPSTTQRSDGRFAFSLAATFQSDDTLSISAVKP